MRSNAANSWRPTTRSIRDFTSWWRARSRHAEVLALAALLGGCAAPQPIASWPARPQGQDRAAADARLAAFPNSAAMLRGALGAAIETGDGPRVAALARRLAAMGGGLSADSRQRMARFVPDAEMAALVARFDANARPMPASRPLVRVPADLGILEGYAQMPSLGSSYFSTVTNRRLYVRGRPDAPIVAVPHADDWGGLFGMAADRRRRILWIASAVVPQTPDPETAFRGLIAFDAAAAKELRRIPGPEGLEVAPGDVALGPDGTVYTSDAMNGALYRCAPGCARLTVLVPPGILRSPQGIAVFGDHLIVADYGYGLARVDLRSGAVARIVAPDTMALDGIDGLVRFGASLIAIQNGANPMRIVRLEPDRAGRRIDRLTVLERANPDWGEPTLGVIGRKGLIYVGDGGWERFGPGSVPNGKGVAKPYRIRFLPLTR